MTPTPTSSAAGSAETVARVVTPETREILRRLELDVTRRLDGLLHGDHRGLVPGHGSELGETRRYAPGDDVRRIDWNVSARLSEPHIRQTIAERELESWIIVDRSSRLDFGTARAEKRDLALAAAGAVGFLTNRDGNRLGAMLVGRGHTNTIPAKGSRKHLMRILHTLAASPRGDGGGVTDLAGAINRLAAVAKRRGLVVVISDFRVGPGWDDALRVMAKRQDVLAIEVTDPRELELPNVGLLTVQDPATGELREIATNKAKVRERYAEAGAQRRADLAASFRSMGVDHLVLSTDQDWLTDVVRFIGARKARLSALSGGRA